MNLAGFNQINFYKDKTQFSSIENLEAANSAIKVKITKTRIDDHKKLISDREYLLESLYNPGTSPYPEAITNTISCSDEFKPYKEEVEGGVIYSLLAGERFNFGVCTKDLIKYYSRYGIFDCNSKGVFEVMVFSEQELGLDNIIKSFSC